MSVSLNPLFYFNLSLLGFITFYKVDYTSELVVWFSNFSRFVSNVGLSGILCDLLNENDNWELFEQNYSRFVRSRTRVPPLILQIFVINIYSYEQFT